MLLRQNRFVMLCIAACSVMSLTVVLLSSQQAIMLQQQHEEHLFPPPPPKRRVGDVRKWQVPPQQELELDEELESAHEDSPDELDDNDDRQDASGRETVIEESNDEDELEEHEGEDTKQRAESNVETTALEGSEDTKVDNGEESDPDHEESGLDQHESEIEDDSSEMTRAEESANKADNKEQSKEESNHDNEDHQYFSNDTVEHESSEMAKAKEESGDRADNEEDSKEDPVDEDSAVVGQQESDNDTQAGDSSEVTEGEKAGGSLVNEEDSIDEPQHDREGSAANPAGDNEPSPDTKVAAVGGLNIDSDDYKQEPVSKEAPVETVHHHKNVTRPPLDSLIKDTDRGIKGHVSFLLDWAVIGHAKAATSFIMKWLDRHPEVRTWREEVCDLFDNRPAGLVKRLYEELPEGDFHRGFKCPAHFSRRAIRLFQRYFRRTKIIVGVRHPVRWFESFYNFRVRHGGDNYTLPEPNKLIGVCTPETDGVCTDRANFHTNLAVFGKTNLSDPVEQNLVRFRKYSYESTYQIDNPIFLYDVAQFYDNSTENMELFKSDLQNFLGLEAPMPEPTKKDAAKSSRPKPKAIDICAPEFKQVREELIVIGKRASMWIRKYFLNADQVFVSNREYFEEILKEWKNDPCLPAQEVAKS